MHNPTSGRHAQPKGFTLLELLIVITIIAIMSVVLIFALNPAEALAKSRDTQRMADLSTFKTAVGVFLATKGNPQLDGTSGTKNDKCDGGTAANEELWVSVNTTAGDGETITDTSPPAGWAGAADDWQQSTSTAAQSLVDGTGWIPIDFTAITGGSPISNLPVDPVNDLSITTGADTSDASDVTNGAQMYRYACKKAPVSFEINARLESLFYGVGSTDDDRALKDGGNNDNLFEVGTDLTILPGTNDF